MIDITHKRNSLRFARGIGKILISVETKNRIEANTLPKGNLFEIAKAASFLAAKNTSSIIPHCHPIGIDYFKIDFSYSDVLENNKVNIEVHAEAKTIGRTGLEIEVLTGVSVACLTIYDLLKPIDKDIEINGIKLLEKKGGKSDKKFLPKKGATAAILVCSDSTFKGNRVDSSGQLIRQRLEEFGIEIIFFDILPDEKFQIQEKLKFWCNEGIQYIFTTGGTGLGFRDTTVEAVREIIDKEIPGIGEAMRTFGNERTPWAMLSRGIAGSRGKTLIVTLPGSSNGAKESLEAILPGIFHSNKMLKGEGHD